MIGNTLFILFTIYV